ncbi:ABC transporter ATP-binding protein [Bosea sp. (in: a-proteobacteria)]|uniref:ABC transporter ATP-binding protein n=1 Tax=Bosea sp. (in: a-proteobacteria) TaxID=1871050 RepID=UPI003B3A0E35
MQPQSIEIAGITKNFGTDPVLKGIDLSIRPGEFLSLVGMSGCGKSTLLRIIAGLETPDSGSITIGGSDVTGVDPSDRNLAMVFQSYALYPHMTVRQNIATPLRMRRLSLAQRLPLFGTFSPGRAPVLREIDAAVEQAAELRQIKPLLDRKPSQLSGGQRQRVALARALVRQPAAFLMDEPLSNLDAKLRAHMRDELAGLHRRLGATFIYVTHDQIEAMTMSDRIALLDAGRILQLGAPSELYEKPACLTVARFIGSPSINLLPVEIDARGRLSFAGEPLPLTAVGETGPATLGLRAEDLTLTDGEGLPAKVERVEHHGADRFLHLTLPQAPETRLILRQTAAQSVAIAADAAVTLAFAPGRAHLFGSDGQRRELGLLERVAA